MALQALSEFASMIYSGSGINMKITANTMGSSGVVKSTTFNINSKNAMILQQGLAADVSDVIETLLVFVLLLVVHCSGRYMYQ